MNISEVLESLIVSTQVNNNIKFTGKIPSEFINKWDELTTEN